MLVVGISGSLRARSHNTQLLKAAALALPSAVSFEFYRDLAAIPPYNEDVNANTAVIELRQTLRAADGVLIATPEYNFSIPGQLKNALDWVSRPLANNPLQGKPVAVIGASRGMFGAVWSQAETRKILGALGARVLDEELPVGASDTAFSSEGELMDPDLQQRLQQIMDALAAAIEVDALTTS